MAALPHRDCRKTGSALANGPLLLSAHHALTPECCMSDPYDGPVADPVASALRGRCPRCGEGQLYHGYLSLRARCDVCGLDYNFVDSGDGPAVFIILIAGFLIVFSALLVEIAFEPPIWVHMVIFLPLTVIVSLGMLRPMKGLMIGQQYRTRAEQGRLGE
jgi:uncharacterized protein (DUF983 family)